LTKLKAKIEWPLFFWTRCRGHSVEHIPPPYYTQTGSVSLKPNSIMLAGSKLVTDRFETKFHYAIWFEPASNQLRTSFEPPPNQIA